MSKVIHVTLVARTVLPTFAQAELPTSLNAQ